VSRKESYSDRLRREGGMVASGKFGGGEGSRPSSAVAPHAPDHYASEVRASLMNALDALRDHVALEQQAKMGWDESRRREQELRTDLARARAALRQIRDYVLLEYQEGDKDFQLALLAITALDETTDV
jgi:hypothetical protein